MSERFLDELKAEQNAFDQALEGLLCDHRGEFVVFCQGLVVGFYQSYSEAHCDAVERFGLQATFLVAEVCEPCTECPSLAWELGSLLGS